MNRFITSEDPAVAAQHQCDKHLRKMIIEEAQMLSTALHDNAPALYTSSLYKPVHQKHPCTLWAGQTVMNFLWAHAHFQALCDEHEYRFGKAHTTANKLRVIFDEITDRADFFRHFHTHELTKHPQCFGPWPHKTSEFWPIKAYRSYLRDYKPTVMKSMAWTRRPQPTWF